MSFPSINRGQAKNRQTELCHFIGNMHPTGRQNPNTLSNKHRISLNADGLIASRYPCLELQDWQQQPRHVYFLSWLCMYSPRKRSQNLSLLFSQQSLRALPRFCRNQAHWTFCFPTQHGHEKRGNALDGNSSDTLLCFGLPWHSPAAENRVARKRLGHSHKEQRATTHHGFPGGRAAPNVRPYSLKLRFYHPGHFTFPDTRPMPRQIAVHPQNEWLGAMLDSGFSDNLLTMFVTLRHLLRVDGQRFQGPRGSRP